MLAVQQAQVTVAGSVCCPFAAGVACLVGPAIFFLADAFGEDAEGEVPRWALPGLPDKAVR